MIIFKQKKELVLLKNQLFSVVAHTIGKYVKYVRFSTLVAEGGIGPPTSWL